MEMHVTAMAREDTGSGYRVIGYKVGDLLERPISTMLRKEDAMEIALAVDSISKIDIVLVLDDNAWAYMIYSPKVS
jgi:hypothetical protein